MLFRSLGESGEFHERRIYDDQNTFNLLNIAADVLGRSLILIHLHVSGVVIFRKKFKVNIQYIEEPSLVVKRV